MSDTKKVWVASGDGGDGCVYIHSVWCTEKYTREEVEQLIRDDLEEDWGEIIFDDHLGENCIAITHEEVNQ